MLIRFIVIRLLQTILTLLTLLTLIFVSIRAILDPVLLMTATTDIARAEDISRFRTNLGLDKSIPEQYLYYMKNLLQFNLGMSIWQSKPVSKIIATALPNTLKLGIPSFAISMILAFALGILGAVKRDTLLDNGIKSFAIIGIAIPPFWLAVMLIFLFAVHWKILPVSASYSDITLAHYVLPVGTMAFFNLPMMLRMVRSAMLDVLDSEYIKLARIKGLPERIVIWKHALRNALITPLTSAGMFFAFIIAGSLITERIFMWPGIGMLTLDAFYRGDYPLISGLILMMTSVILISNLIVDILYAVIDPQIRNLSM